MDEYTLPRKLFNEYLAGIRDFSSNGIETLFESLEEKMRGHPFFPVLREYHQTMMDLRKAETGVSGRFVKKLKRRDREETLRI